MDTMKAALEKVGFGEFEKQKTEVARVRWLFENGLRSVLPIKQTRLHLGLVKLGALTVADERYVTRKES